MDWAKAKTILIFIFLALNIFLLYNVVLQESKVTVISQKDIEDIKNILERNNIELKTEIPNKIKPKSFLRVEDIVYNEQELINDFFDNNVENVVANKITNDDIIYSEGTKSLEIYSNKKIIYNDGQPSDAIEGLNKNKIIKYVEKFLKDRNFYPKYCELDEFKITENGYEVTYKQVFKGYQVFSSYIKVKLSPKGITKVESFWANPVQFVDAPKDIKTPLEILLAFAKDKDNKEKIVINEIQLGYYFPTDNFKNASVSAIPTWKIQTSDGRVYYYNAYEGYLEKKEDKG